MANMLLQNLDELYKPFIRPARKRYTVAELGPDEFSIGAHRVRRNDFQVSNRRNLRIRGSLFKPEGFQPATSAVVIYLHGNGGCRKDALPLLHLVIPLGMSLVAFDFAGTGQSEGEFITLGFNERFDLEAIIDYVHKNIQGCSNILLWGRSMGAATSLLYAGEHSNKIKGVIADSPFSCLTELTLGWCRNKISELVPEFLFRIVIDEVRDQVRARVGVDIFEKRPIEAAKNITCPLLLAVAKDDQLTHPNKVREIYEVAKNNNPLNKLCEFEGDHNSDRPDHYLKEAKEFLKLILTQSLQKQLQQQQQLLQLQLQQAAKGYAGNKHQTPQRMNPRAVRNYLQNPEANKTHRPYTDNESNLNRTQFLSPAAVPRYNNPAVSRTIVKKGIFVDTVQIDLGQAKTIATTRSRSKDNKLEGSRFQIFDDRISTAPSSNDSLEDKNLGLTSRDRRAVTFTTLSPNQNDTSSRMAKPSFTKASSSSNHNDMRRYSANPGVNPYVNHSHK